MHAPEPADAEDTLSSGPTARERPNHSRPKSVRNSVPGFPRSGMHTEGGDRSPLARPHLLGDPGGAADPDQTVHHCVNRL